MKNIPTGWYKSIFTRLLIIFLLILVPLYFGGIAIYGWGVAQVQDSTSQTLSSEGSSWMEGFELEVERIRMLQYECLTDPDLDDLCVRAGTLDDMQRTQAMNRLLNRLTAIKSSSRYIRQVIIYIPAISRTLLSRGSTTELNAEEFRKACADSASQFPLVFRDGTAWLSAVYPIQNTSGSRTVRDLIAVELSLPELQRSIAGGGEGSSRKSVLASSDGLLLSAGLDDEMAAQMAADPALAKSSSGLASLWAGGVRYLASRTASGALSLSLYRFVPEVELFAPLNRYRLWFWLFTGAAVVIISLFTIASRRLIDRPLAILVQSFRSVENGNLDVRIEHRADDEFRYLYRHFDDMTSNLKTLIDQVYKQKILAQALELKHLQSQISPHFLFNSFFLLQNMVERGDNEGASAFTRQLGAYFQFITRSADDEVTLEKEAAHARAYAQIQARRFRGRIAVEFGDVPFQHQGLVVPRLIIQPVIENAFEHGLEQKASGGLLKVSFETEAGMLTVRVEDNGGGMNAERVEEMNAQLDAGGESVESTALINIHRRLRLRFGVRSGMKFSVGDGGGLVAELLIQLEQEGDPHVQAVDC